MNPTIVNLIKERLELGRRKYKQPVRALDTAKVQFLSSTTLSSLINDGGSNTVVFSDDNYWSFHILEEHLDAIVYYLTRDIYNKYKEDGATLLIDHDNPDSVDCVYEQLFKSDVGDNLEILEKLESGTFENEKVNVLCGLVKDILEELV